MSNRVKILIKSLITLLLLGYLFSRMDLAKFLEVLLSANWLLVAAVSALYFCTVFFVTSRWKVILANFDIHTPFITLMRITLIGYFFNMFLPSAIGGDFFRAFYLAKRESRGMSTTLTTTVLDRGSGLSALLLIGLAASIINPIEVEGRSLTIVFLGIGLLFLTALFLTFNPWIHRRVSNLLLRLKWDGLEKKTQLVFEGILKLRENRVGILLVMFLSVSVQLLMVVLMWIAAQSLHIDSPFRWFLVFIPIVNLATAIPLTINGVGLRESVYFLLFTRIGVPMESAITLSLLNLFVFAVTAVIGGIVYSLYKKEQEFSIPDAEELSG